MATPTQSAGARVLANAFLRRRIINIYASTDPRLPWAERDTARLAQLLRVNKVLFDAVVELLYMTVDFAKTPLHHAIPEDRRAIYLNTVRTLYIEGSMPACVNIAGWPELFKLFPRLHQVNGYHISGHWAFSAEDLVAAEVQDKDEDHEDDDDENGEGRPPNFFVIQTDDKLTVNDDLSLSTELPRIDVDALPQEWYIRLQPTMSTTPIAPAVRDRWDAMLRAAAAADVDIVPDCMLELDSVHVDASHSFDTWLLLLQARRDLDLPLEGGFAFEQRLMPDQVTALGRVVGDDVQNIDFVVARADLPAFFALPDWSLYAAVNGLEVKVPPVLVAGNLNLTFCIAVPDAEIELGPFIRDCVPTPQDMAGMLASVDEEVQVSFMLDVKTPTAGQGDRGGSAAQRRLVAGYSDPVQRQVLADFETEVGRHARSMNGAGSWRGNTEW